MNIFLTAAGTFFLTALGGLILFIRFSKPQSPLLRTFMLPRSLDPDNDLGKLFAIVIGTSFCLLGSFGLVISLLRLSGMKI
jgi:hypothetical protein